LQSEIVNIQTKNPEILHKIVLAPLELHKIDKNNREIYQYRQYMIMESTSN